MVWTRICGYKRSAEYGKIMISVIYLTKLTYVHENRLINIMTLLDCAFSFFANFPCRLIVTEMKFDLPCEEFLFSSQHPFSEPKFKISRELTTYEAFKSLFIPEKSSPPTSHGKKNPLSLNALDMFILIHRAYLIPSTPTRQC
jgi:hypothetical protein